MHQNFKIADEKSSIRDGHPLALSVSRALPSPFPKLVAASESNFRKMT